MLGTGRRANQQVEPGTLPAMPQNRGHDLPRVEPEGEAAQLLPGVEVHRQLGVEILQASHDIQLHPQFVADGYEFAGIVAAAFDGRVAVTGGLAEYQHAHPVVAHDDIAQQRAIAAHRAGEPLRIGFARHQPAHQAQPDQHEAGAQQNSATALEACVQRLVIPVPPANRRISRNPRVPRHRGKTWPNADEDCAGR